MLRLTSLFSGIGAFEKALNRLKVSYELVGFSEIDKYAVKSYCAIHDVPESMNLGDITKIDEKSLPRGIDLITYGFPCQDISLAGKQKGLFNEDGTQTRSGLFFEALRIIEATQPRVAIAENVKNLTSKKFSEQFKIVLDSLEEAGYNNYWQVLNAKDYGIPQNRERVFIVSIRKDIDTGCFQFPEGFPLKLRLKDLLEDEVDEKYYLKKKDTDVFKMLDSVSEDTSGCIQVGNLDRPTTHDFSNRIYSPNGIARTLMGSGGNQNDKAGQYLVETEKVINVGNVNPSGRGQNGAVIDSEGLARTITVEKGEGQKILVREATKIGYAEAVEGDSINLEHPNSKTRRGRVGHQVAQTLTTSPNQGVVISEPTIHRIDIPQTVLVRKYEVDTENLAKTLREHKMLRGYTNREISMLLNVPLTKVEHWFRTDGCFAIPEPDIWMKLKILLKITINDFDESIMTFEEKEGVYEKSERHYFADGISPTLTSASAGNEKFIVEGGVNVE